ncbi:MmcQ/YjbR family DNA-binding protein [Listeria seeligeri]|uniref:MmcQ/YjbR family DNA-binding protein n=1 Tax=Listeria seeligeri TaxID=1640 RepID=UPI00162A9652|nr:MmcQ/YjbR family DNA-binding protein [Listeria seeligeri]MBC1430468.1 MmcQ/YjbR family DNA-binding protein [Listeria seeligeri]MBC1729952.1 MmcQ/YjbR family DNA-binding protein [Listeria seeligeri]MBC1775341.1 MmcQ/YjbR family DNA-binding protein [Listeria seeligeri]MBC1823899.1 MmcQ/YjbR family DNA-binding protein [Listeria seeligeri]MBC1837673.1 MmcQ/YjbR family DNA-binding protein [Listeria seeligeri]
MSEEFGWIKKEMTELPGVQYSFKEEWQAGRYHVLDQLMAMRGTDNAGNQILTLKCDAEKSEQLRAENPAVIPGYYMNKRVWISVLLEKEQDKELIRALIHHAYTEAKNKLPKYKQSQLETF